MPVVIKEIQVKTVVEKKVVLPEEISAKTLELIKDKVLEELLSGRDMEPTVGRDRKER